VSDDVAHGVLTQPVCPSGQDCSLTHRVGPAGLVKYGEVADEGVDIPLDSAGAIASDAYSDSVRECKSAESASLIARAFSAGNLFFGDHRADAFKDSPVLDLN